MKFAICGSFISVTEGATLIRNTETPCTVEFQFDDAWDGYTKQAVFRAGAANITVPLEGDACTLPAECLKEGGVWLSVLVEGTKEDESIHTSECRVGMVLYDIDPDELDPGDDSGGGGGSGVDPFITVVLSASGWKEKLQTVTDALFKADSNYAYLVCPDADCYAAYGEAGIVAKNVIVSGELTFECTTEPEEDFTVNIIEQEVDAKNG